MLLKPTGTVAAMGADAGSGAGEGREAGVPDRWMQLVDEFKDVFEPPGMPAERDVVHRIETVPGSVPPFRR